MTTFSFICSVVDSFKLNACMGSRCSSVATSLESRSFLSLLLIDLKSFIICTRSDLNCNFSLSSLLIRSMSIHRVKVNPFGTKPDVGFWNIATTSSVSRPRFKSSHLCAAAALRWCLVHTMHPVWPRVMMCLWIKKKVEENHSQFRQSVRKTIYLLYVRRRLAPWI